jgi:bla regulator protein BlaR1
MKVRHETKELPIFALVVAKNGVKASPTKLPPARSGDAAASKDQAARGTDVTGKGLEFTAVAIGVTFAQLAAILAREPELGGRVARDETGLKGEYDFTLQWTREQLSASGGGDADASTPLEFSGPAFFTALQQQLGLKLESKKGPVDTIVIEHIERPSGN